VFVGWHVSTGYFPRLLCCRSSGGQYEHYPLPDVGVGTVKKWQATPAPRTPGDSPPVVSVVLKKFPRLLAFQTDRWYDDGSPRLPGSVWFDSDLGASKAMLKEPSLCLCARIRAATVDELYAAIELFLSLDNPPWEHDRFAAEKVQPKKKK
jgi:hypothetical protein